MSLPEQIGRYMSLREPQREALSVLDRMSDGLDYTTARLADLAADIEDRTVHIRFLQC